MPSNHHHGDSLKDWAISFVIPTAIILGLIGGMLWIAHRFSLEGRLQDRFGIIALAVPFTDKFMQPGVDISPQICPLLDEELREELEPMKEVEVGNLLFGLRLLIIESAAPGQCSAKVYHRPIVVM
jgi:hypothetical protein